MKKVDIKEMRLAFNLFLLFSFLSLVFLIKITLTNRKKEIIVNANIITGKPAKWSEEKGMTN